MKSGFLTPGLCLMVCLLGSASQAQTPAPPQRTQAMTDLAACRVVVADAERLACYDRLVGALDQAEAAGEVVVVDRSQVTQARRALFGFSMPTLPPLFTRGGPQDEPIDAIDSTVLRASQGQSGKWIFVLEDESVWVQTDTGSLVRTPRPGTAISIRQGAVGSYLLSVNGARSIRVRRQQ